jgi:predicted rRNA methylase YqxC with S4 and FtsJ domains
VRERASVASRAATRGSAARLGWSWKPLLAPGAALAALIKPQFEAGREHVGRGGLVRDEAVQDSPEGRAARETG